MRTNCRGLFLGELLASSLYLHHRFIVKHPVGVNLVNHKKFFTTMNNNESSVSSHIEKFLLIFAKLSGGQVYSIHSTCDFVIILYKISTFNLLIKK